MIERHSNYNIKNETTFKIGGSVSEVVFPSSVEELIKIMETEEYDVILGGCSNVLFTTQHVDKKVVITKNIKTFKFEDTKLTVSCGVRGPFISKECQNRGLSGFEFLIGFPGTFGGMLCMNASAHNQAISDNFIEATVYDTKNKNIIKLNKDKMEFSYRNSKVSGSDFIVLDALFELKRDDTSKIKELMNRNIAFRQSRQPSLTLGNAGSIFKNPKNDSAGRLLDLCGLKGEKFGGAMIYENHANFIVNFNNASSTDVLTLMNKMYSNVKEKYTIELKPEIKYIGNKETEEYKLWENLT